MCHVEHYVSNTSKFEAATGWRPRVNAREGVSNLYNWLLEFRSPAEAGVAAPVAVGQDTDAVLRDVLGYDAARIAALRTTGALG